MRIKLEERWVKELLKSTESGMGNCAPQWTTRTRVRNFKCGGWDKFSDF